MENINQLSKLFSVIDNRIKLILNSTKITKIYSAVVIAKTPVSVKNPITGEEETVFTSASCKVRIAGEKTVFTMVNKSGEELSEGDSVYIQTIGYDLNTGIIIQKMTPKDSLPNPYLYPIGSAIMLTENVLPESYFGGQWEIIETHQNTEGFLWFTWVRVK